MKITDDFLAGLLFSSTGIAGVAVGIGYGIGTPARMGSGFVPVLISAVIAFLGALILVRALTSTRGARQLKFSELRPLVFVSASVVAFAVVVNQFGLIPALLALIVVAWMADQRGKLIELPIVAVLLIAAIVGIFVYGLGMPLRLLRW